MSHAIHHLAVWQRAVFLLNSRRGSFTAPGIEFRDPFFRSYGASVPSSLTRFLSRALVFSYLSTCVGFGTDAGSIPRSFSWRPDVKRISLALPLRDFSAPQPDAGGICLPCGLQPSTRYSSSAPALPPASLHRSNNIPGCRNIRLLSIAYAFCLGLGPDLP